VSLVMKKGAREVAVARTGRGEGGAECVVVKAGSVLMGSGQCRPSHPIGSFELDPDGETVV
jgi:hypothetical protein